MHSFQTLVLLAVFATWSPAPAQTANKDMLTLLMKRKEPPIADIYEGASKPETVFRSNTLKGWMSSYRDPHPEHAKNARQAFIAMGADAVPFLLACHKLLEWNEDHTQTAEDMIVHLEGKSIAPLVRMLSTDFGIEAYVLLDKLLHRHDLGLSYTTGTKTDAERAEVQTWVAKVQEEKHRTLGLLLPNAAGKDPFNRYAALMLFQPLVRSATEKDQAKITGLARRMMRGDESLLVRGAACEMLAVAGFAGVAGGLSVEEAESMVKNPELCEPVRFAAMKRRVLEQSNKKDAEPATPPIKR